jgi:hypothetical protein
MLNMSMDDLTGHVIIKYGCSLLSGECSAKGYAAGFDFSESLSMSQENIPGGNFEASKSLWCFLSPCCQ